MSCSGRAGNTGRAGPDGFIGPTGFTGFTGATGYTGPTGPPGFGRRSGVALGRYCVAHLYVRTYLSIPYIVNTVIEVYHKSV